MPHERAPITCSLTATDLEKRLAEIRDLGSSAMISTEVVKAQATLRFRADEGVAQRLEAIVAAEAECCPFLTLRVAPSGGGLELSIQAPDDARATVEDLAGVFAEQNR